MLLYNYDTYGYFAGHAQLLRSQSRSCTKYFFTTDNDNIIPLDRYFNLTYKSNITGRLLQFDI